MNESNIYPRTGDRQTVYLKHAVKGEGRTPVHKPPAQGSRNE